MTIYLLFIAIYVHALYFCCLNFFENKLVLFLIERIIIYFNKYNN